jgi:hypothetical protein
MYSATVEPEIKVGQRWRTPKKHRSDGLNGESRPDLFRAEIDRGTPHSPNVNLVDLWRKNNQ